MFYKIILFLVMAVTGVSADPTIYDIVDVPIEREMPECSLVNDIVDVPYI